MEERVKNIIALFLNQESDKIHPGTVIDRTALSTSIQLHRMFARLADDGFLLEDYSTIRTVEDLFHALALTKGQESVERPAREFVISDKPSNQAVTIGIDVEVIAALPRTKDFRSDPFYTMNFAAQEISYCILKPDPYSSFAGLFAAKEAIAKANNAYRKLTFNQIIIDHSDDGKPIHPSFQLSISHTGDLAVAAAIAVNEFSSPDAKVPEISRLPTAGVTSWIAGAALIISIIALIIALF